MVCCRLIVEAGVLGQVRFASICGDRSEKCVVMASMVEL